MAKVVMKLNGKVVGTAEHEDIDIAMNDAIRDYYVYKDHGLTHDELWDMIEDGAFDFEILEFNFLKTLF